MASDLSKAKAARDIDKRDRNAIVVEFIRRHEQASTTADLEIMNQLAQDKNVLIRLALIDNSRCPAAALAMLAADPDSRLRTIAIKHPNCPDHIQAIIALGRTPNRSVAHTTA